MINANELLLKAGLDHFVKVQDLTDGYHSFADLYKHRTLLFRALLKYLEMRGHTVYKTKKHWDEDENPMYEGYFVAGFVLPNNKHATYHFEDLYWDLFDIQEIERVPQIGIPHTSDDVLNILAELTGF